MAIDIERTGIGVYSGLMPKPAAHIDDTDKRQYNLVKRSAHSHYTNSQRRSARSIWIVQSSDVKLELVYHTVAWAVCEKWVELNTMLKEFHVDAESVYLYGKRVETITSFLEDWYLYDRYWFGGLDKMTSEKLQRNFGFIFFSR